MEKCPLQNTRHSLKYEGLYLQATEVGFVEFSGEGCSPISGVRNLWLIGQTWQARTFWGAMPTRPMCDIEQDTRWIADNGRTLKEQTTTKHASISCWEVGEHLLKEGKAVCIQWKLLLPPSIAFGRRTNLSSSGTPVKTTSSKK